MVSQTWAFSAIKWWLQISHAASLLLCKTFQVNSDRIFILEMRKSKDVFKNDIIWFPSTVWHLAQSKPVPQSAVIQFNLLRWAALNQIALTHMRNHHFTRSLTSSKLNLRFDYLLYGRFYRSDIIKQILNWNEVENFHQNTPI